MKVVIDEHFRSLGPCGNLAEGKSQVCIDERYAVSGIARMTMIRQIKRIAINSWYPERPVDQGSLRVGSNLAHIEISLKSVQAFSEVDYRRNIINHVTVICSRY